MNIVRKRIPAAAAIYMEITKHIVDVLHFNAYIYTSGVDCFLMMIIGCCIYAIVEYPIHEKEKWLALFIFFASRFGCSISYTQTAHEYETPARLDPVHVFNHRVQIYIRHFP